jgi:hypothetical protein
VVAPLELARARWSGCFRAWFSAGFGPKQGDREGLVILTTQTLGSGRWWTMLAVTTHELQLEVAVVVLLDGDPLAAVGN